MQELNVEEIFQACRFEPAAFETTEDLEPLESILGQDRAIEAVQFGIDIQHEGYHIFAMGPAGTGKLTLVQQFLGKNAVHGKPSDDWCYVNNFEESYRPKALCFPAGRGTEFREAVQDMIDGILSALPKEYESDEYGQRRKALEEEVFGQQYEDLQNVYKVAEESNLEVVWTPAGVVLRPTADGKPMTPQEIDALPEEQQAVIQEKAEGIQEAIQEVMRRAPEAQREAKKRIKELNTETAHRVIGPFVNENCERFHDLEHVVAYCEEMREDLVRNLEPFLKIAVEHPNVGEDEDVHQALNLESPVERYAVNLVVDNSKLEGAPVVYEPNPTYQNVLGRVEYLSIMGALVTNFMLIKAGSLHRANGGYLILDAAQLLQRPFVWDALKRALRSQYIRIESPAQEFGYINTISLEPEPVPVNTKIVLLGNRLLYQLLSEYDPEFPELFKVPAEFETDTPRSPEEELLFARFVATLARKFELRPFAREAVERVVEHAARLADDAQKLTVHMRSIIDFIREADYWARTRNRETVAAEDVQSAIEGKVKRSSRVSEKLSEMIERDVVLIQTEGECIGQVNGLSVYSSGDLYFGRPTRITARASLGEGGVVDIEREVELGGATHSKGVLILQGFLTGRYARNVPLSLSASLAFEQSYNFISGDSASMAELCALLSAIADIPLKQHLAMTGSINQKGEVQAIGAANEKVEGFFTICERRGLTGDQGVILPASNVQFLMLGQKVVQAVADGKFHLYSVETVDEAMELLSGMPAGERDEEGAFPRQSINGLVSARLEELATKRHQFLSASDKPEDE